MKRFLGFGVVLGMMGIGSVARAADLYVPGSYATIQLAINAAVAGDTVWVANGTYTGTGNKELGWTGKKITVRSVNGANNCIINCQNSGRGFYFSNAYDCGTISGFTIRNGNVSDNGGGIYCNYSSPSITNCVISNNTATGGGGGIYCNYSSSPSITNCIISNNTAYYGGGITCYHSSFPSITNCVISNNILTSSRWGGGIHCCYSSPSITNCIISNNANYGVYEENSTSDPSTNYNCFWNNTVDYYDEGTTQRNVAWLNTTAGYTGNISADPKFIGAGNFHLQSTSPCIDTGLNTAPGIPSTDKDGNPRIINSRVDIGAYEFHSNITGIISYSGTKTGSLYYSAFDNQQLTGTPTAGGTVTTFSGPGTVSYTLCVCSGTYYVRAYLDADNDKSPTVYDPIGIYGTLSTVYCYPWQVIGTPTAVNVSDGSITSGIDFVLSREVEFLLGEAVDNTQLTWTTGGDADWFGQQKFSYYDCDAAQSGKITDSQQTYIQTTVTGPWLLTFYWKVSSQSGSDYLRFYIDDIEKAKISGEPGWNQQSYFIPQGTHTVKWAYTKDSSGSSGSDCGWIDKVEFIPGGEITGFISYPGTKTGTLYYSAFDNQQFIGTPVAEGTAIVSSPGAVSYTLPLTPGTYYIRAYLDADNDESPSAGDPIGIYGTLSVAHCLPYQIIGLSIPVNISNSSIVSDFMLSQEVKQSLGDAVDNTELRWTTSGNADWFRQTEADFTYDGEDAAQSGDITDNQQTSIQTTVSGAGLLTFYWKVSSQGGADYLRFYIDDIEQSKISGEAGWIPQMSYFIPLGMHTLKWAYTKDSSGSSGKDCGWLDKVEFIHGDEIIGLISYAGTKSGTLYYSAFTNPQWTGTPTTEGTRTFSGPGTTSWTLGAPPGTYYIRAYLDADNNKIPSVGDPIDIYGSLSAVYYPWQVIGTPTAVNVSDGSITSGIDFVLSRKIEERVLLLEAVDAIGNPEFTGWETGGSGTALWFGQSNYYCYGTAAAQSGYITHNQQTYIQTKVLGTGTLNFYWKVSSQSGYDYLRFYIDGNQQNYISGEAGWTQMSYFIPAGTHTLKWEYKKDSSVSIGSDCGWLDKVEFIPWGRITGLISYSGTKTGALHYDAVTDIESPFGKGGQIGGQQIVELLTGQSEATWLETGWYVYRDPFNTECHDSRAQAVYLASDLIAAGMSPGKITALQLKCYQGPGRPNLKNFHIRMKQTSAITSTAWETTGWTSVFGATDIIPTAGQWFNFVLSAPFTWDGVSNLLIDLSRDDTAYIAGGGMYVRTGLTNRTYAGYSNSGYTWPFDGMSGAAVTHVPSLRVEFISEGTGSIAAEFNGPGAINYALEVPPGTYYVRAYLDVCHDGGPTEYDPIGIYGSLSAAYYPWQIISTPEPIEVGSRAIVSDKNIELNHKVILRNLLAEGLDNAGLVWKTGGAANWLTDYYNYFYGNASAQSDKIQDNQETYIQTEVFGTGTLRFYWKVSSQSYTDYLRFYIDGNEKNAISGATGWTQMSYVVLGGTHTLKWVYKKDGSGYSGSDCGWLDKVEFIPWGRITGLISYSGTKTGSLYYSAFDNQQWTGTPVAGGTVTTFSGPGTVSYSLEAYPGTYYLRAYLDADNDISPSVNDPVGISGTLSLVYCHPLQVIGTPTPIIVYSGSINTGIDFGLKSEVKDFLGEVVDTPEFVWTTGGNADWLGQTATYCYDGDAGRSGAITHNQQTYIQTTVTCTYQGILTFYWKVSSQSYADYLRFYINGNQQNAISGEAGWTQMSYFIPTGTHTLKWVYTKDSSGSNGSDCGWLDKVEFIPWGRITGLISYSGTKSGSLYYSAFDNQQWTGTPIAGGTAIVSSPGTVSYSLEIPEGTYSLLAYLDADNDISPSDHEPVGICGSLSLVYCHPWQIVGTPTPVNVYSSSTTQGIDFGLSHNVQSLIGEAVDNTELIWRIGGTADWFRQTDADYSYYDGDAAQSGKIEHGDKIEHSQETYIQTTVTSPGTLAFYWKVSSEGGADYLRFYIDEIEQSKISNEVDWTQLMYFIPLGTHTLKWAYTKNDRYVNGKDCGWVDKVGFTPAPVGRISGLISYTGTKTGTLYYSAFDNPQFKGIPIRVGTDKFISPGTVSYSLEVFPGTYCLRAYIDVDNDTLPTADDPVGIYGTLSTVYYPWEVIGTPASVYVQAGSITEGIDFELTHNIESKEKEWTFMVYLDGDNNLESAAITDFLEMAGVGSTPEINIVAQFDRIYGYDTSYEGWTAAKRFRVTKGMTPTPGNALEDIGEVNMGDPAVLTDFMNWAISKYPAKRYGLILWNHGGGWKLEETQTKPTYKEVCVDDTSKDVLFMKEVKEALATTTTNLGQKIDLVGFDACLMGMIEVGYWIKDYAGVMVGSEELVPNDGFPYTPILSILTQNPTMPAEELGKIVVQEYIKSYGSTTYNVTLSAIDLNKVNEVASSTNNLVNLISDGYWDKIKYGRDNVQEYYDNTHIDLSHFARLIRATITETNIQNAANRLVETIDSAIIANGEKGYPDSYGLAIYLPDPDPVNEQMYDENYDYIDFAKATIWDEFLKSYYDNYVKGTITKLGSPVEVLPGGTVTYTITYCNIGATPFFCGIINDILPPELEFVDSNPPYYSYAPNFYSWKVGTISPYQEGTITVIVRVATNTPPGSCLENKAELCNGSKNLLCSSIFSIYVDTPIMGSLTINSIPSGAKIYLDGADTGRLTNWTFTNMLAGTHTIRLTLSGYEDWRSSVLITTGTTTIVEAVLNKATPVTVDPSKKIVNVKEEFEIDIKVGSVTSLYGFQFDLRFDPDLLEVVSITEGSFLKSDGASTIWVPPTIGTDSILNAGCSRFGTFTGKNGIGTLTIVKLRSKKVGTSSIELSNVIFKDNSTPIPQTISVIPGNGVISVAPWDVVRNDKIDISDLSTVGIHFGETSASPNFYPPADINEDKNINITDLSTVGIHFGEKYSPTYKLSNLSFFMPFMKPLSQNPLVGVDPGVQSVAKETQFSVDIKIGSVTNLYGFEFNMRFDPDLLEVISVTEGLFLKNDGASTFWIPPTIGTDSILTGCSRLSTFTGMSGTGTLAVVTFRAKAEGVGLLNLQNVSLVDNSLPVPQGIPSDVANGTVTIVVVASISHDVTDPLGIEDVLTVTMQGQAGGKGTFTVSGMATTTMTEISAGTYTGTYTIKAGDNIIGGTVTGYLYIGTTTYTKDATGTVTLDGILPISTAGYLPEYSGTSNLQIPYTASDNLGLKQISLYIMKEGGAWTYHTYSISGTLTVGTLTCNLGTDTDGRWLFYTKAKDIADNEELFTGSDTSTIVDTIKPATPTLVSVINPAQDGRLNLIWTPGTDTNLAGYKIYYGTQSGSYTQTADTGSTATSYQLSNLTNGIRYYIAISAIDRAQNESAKSNELSERSTGPLSKIRIEDGEGMEICTRTMATDGSQTLYLKGYDAGNNPIGYVAGTWTILGGIGNLTLIYGTSTIFDPTKVGYGTITATDGVHQDTTDAITVNMGQIIQIKIVDENDQEIGTKTLIIDDILTMYLRGYDNDFNMAYVSGTWTVKGGIGVVGSTYGTKTYFNATTPGIGTISATDGVHTDTTEAITIEGFGSIAITSSPPGAMIYLDGVDTAKITPATLTDVIRGIHTIRLVKTDYVNWTGSVTVITGKTTIIEAVLHKPTPVTVDPSKKIVNVKDEFEINIKVGSVASLYGFQFDMRFDPNLLEVVSVIQGPFLKSDGASTIWTPPTIGTDSILNTGCSRFGTTTGVSGIGTLVIVKLKSKKVGTSSIELSNIILTDNSTPVPQTISVIPGKGVISVAPWDVVRNDKIDIIDLSTVGIHFGETPVSPGWYPPADIDENKVINIIDLSTVGIHFGEKYPPTYKLSNLSFFMPFLKPLSQNPLVKVDPEVQSVARETQFSVDIKIGSVTNLYGFEFDMRFDPDLLEVVSVTEGPFLKSNGASTFWTPLTIGTDSISKVGCTRLGTTTGVSGTGTLAMVKFRAKAEGVSLLDLQNVSLVDNSLPVPQEISSDVADGTVAITGLIFSITHNATAPLGIGKVLTVTMQGQAGGNATFTVAGVATTTMTENAGTYTGSYTIKAGDNIIGGTVTGYLTIGATTYTKDATTTVTFDTTPPIITRIIEPASNTYLSGTVTVKLIAKDDETGIDMVRLYWKDRITTFGNIPPGQIGTKTKEWVTTEDGTYDLYCVAIDQAENQATSTTAYPVTIDNTKPATPTLVSVTNSAQDGKLNLIWTPGTDTNLFGYKVYYGTQSGTYTQTQDTGSIAISYQLTGLTNGTAYYIAISAYDKAQNESTKSNELSGTPTGSLAKIRIENQTGQEIGTVSITTDGTLTLYLRGYDAGDRLIGDVPGTWTVLSNIGTASPVYGISTIFNPTTVGIGTISATDSAHTDTTEAITVNHGSPTAFSLQPSVFSLTADGSLTLTAIAQDADGNTWTVTGETLFSAVKGSFTSNIYNPKEIGTWTITGTYTNLIATATVSVSHGSATKISISPQNLNTYVGVVTQYSATGTDTDGNSFSVPATFTITANAGTFTDNQFKAGSAGTYEITAHYLNLIATTTVVIQPHGVAVQISLQLSTSTTTADGTITCTVCGTDTLGISWDATDEATFTTTGGSGTFTKNIYNPCKEGIWIITTQLGTPTATATVTVIHGQPATLTLTPATCTLTADGSQLYKGTATDSDGNSWDETGNIAMWSTTDPKGTMIANIYYPGQVDTWTITGTTTNGIVGTATVNVTPGDYVNLHITAATTTITYATFTITVTLQDMDGNGYTGILAMTNTTQSISPATITIISGTGTAIATITQSPEGGTDTITVSYNQIKATRTIRVFVNSTQGGTVTDAGVAIEFDPGDLGTTNVTVHITTLTQTYTPPTGIQFVGVVYNIELKDEQEKPVGTVAGQIGTVCVKFSYFDEPKPGDGWVDGTNIREENLVIYCLEAGTWTALPTTVNGTENFAFAYVLHFSTFTLTGTPTISAFASNNDNVKVYPNPYKEGVKNFGGGKVSFGGVSEGAVIKIYNIAGELVDTIDAGQSWDVRNIASGVYIYTVTGGGGGKSVGKIGIVK